MFPSRFGADSQLAETQAIALSGLVFWIWTAAFLYACSSSCLIMCYLNNIMLRNTAEVKKSLRSKAGEKAETENLERLPPALYLCMSESADCYLYHLQ